MLRKSKIAIGLAAAVMGCAAAQAQPSMGYAFTYQGSLKDGGAPANGVYDFVFTLYTTSDAVIPVGDGVSLEDVQVTNGLFNVKLNFGANFDGRTRWLRISVRPGTSTGAFSSLSPRQELTPTPHAVTARQLALPYTGTADTNATIIPTGVMSIYQEGSAYAIVGTNTGTGPAGLFQIMNQSSNAPALTCRTYGTGPALWADGLARVDVLEITGGSDLSEGFEVSGDDVKPGMVVCIDPEKPGELKVASKATDTTVAGIISGAGGVKTGMVMGQKETIADGKHPVALTGRVYCYADASKGAIKPGDLLTTSDTPGHAMKVADPAKASGAIIGKAMTSLDEGTGLVLVLVNLH